MDARWRGQLGAGDGETRQHSSHNEIISRTVTAILSDDNGNENDDGTQLYRWDSLDRLSAVTRKSDSALVAVSTLFTKQHYIADVIAGLALAGAAYFAFLRGYARTAIPQLDERVVTVVMLGFAGFHALLLAGFGVAYVSR